MSTAALAVGVGLLCLLPRRGWSWHEASEGPFCRPLLELRLMLRIGSPRLLRPKTGIDAEVWPMSLLHVLILIAWWWRKTGIDAEVWPISLLHVLPLRRRCCMAMAI